MMFSRQAKLRALTFTVLLVGTSVLLVMGWMSSVATALQGPSVEVGPDHTRQASAGQTLIYHHTLTNTGTATDSFWLEVSSSQGWPVELSGGDYPTGTLGTLMLPQVGVQMTASFRISLTIPLGTAGVTEITIVTVTSQLSPTVQGTARDTTIVPFRTYLPLILKHWPPIPYKPTLSPISNDDGDGSYAVSWIEQPSRLADTYTLQEATDAAFTGNLSIVCTTSQDSCIVSGKLAGTYYYRVQGRNAWGYGDWSTARSVTVLPPTASHLNPIDNADGDGDYTITWNAATRATSYVLQEGSDESLSSPTTVYTGPDLSWSATGKAAGTYYYRVQAVGPTGTGAWSNVQAATVIPPTAVPSPEITCWVSNSSPARYTNVTVYGKLARGTVGISGVPMQAEWHYKTTTSYCSGTSGSNGVASCSRYIAGATAGYRVYVYVTMTYDNQTYRCTTSFTPH